jgi:NitT/TauT family transport system permease protein
MSSFILTPPLPNKQSKDLFDGGIALDNEESSPKPPRFIGLFAAPPRGLAAMLISLPFVILVAVYLVASEVRHNTNPDDKVLPTIARMAKAVEQVAFTMDQRTGSYLLWRDTASSLKRIGMGIGLAAVSGLLIGLNIGMLPGFRTLSLAFVTFVSIVPPLAILPILFISFGVGELAKIVLIFIGTFPMITRGMYLAVKKMPDEQIPKALTLGASQTAVIYRIMLPQIMPRLLDTVRLTLGAAWLFLIAGEAIASTDGLGYRIFLVRRYLSMDVIIPYVIWITFLGFAMDRLLLKWIALRYPWYLASEE